MRPDFQQRFDQWLADWQKLIDQHTETNYPNTKANLRRILSAERLQKRMRVWCQYADQTDSKDRGSCFAFVDLETGDILKPATWKAPAKHARGNIFDEHKGMAQLGPFGPNYLR